jgi:hypothetical protein
MLGVKHQSWWRVLWFFRRTHVSPLGRPGNPRHDVWFLIINIQAKRVAIVSSVITRYLTLSSIGRSRFNLSGQTLNDSVSVLLLSVYCLTVVHSVFFYSIQCFLLFDSLFDYSVFDYSVYFSVLILELYSRYFDPHKQNHPAVNKHRTADSTILVLV